ncbi:MAG: DUF2070 family protein, partial [Candidatus Bathyarchaeota archaeon]
RDLTKSGDNGVVVDSVLENIPKTPIAYQASPMAWAEEGEAKASCQVFGDTALITLTLAPLSYDDLPEQIVEEIVGWAGRRGLRGIVVDSHNSIDLEGGLDTYETGDVTAAAREAVEAAEGAQKQLFEVATARMIPGEWGLDQGMGSGGISVLVVRLGDGSQYAYIVLDGNNMVQGLRARLLHALESAGFSGGEVLTSDVHTVNAIGAAGKGYSPIGERMDQEALLDYILETVDEVVNRLEPGGVLSSRTEIKGMRVLGPGGLARFRHILESGFDLFVRAGLSIGVVCFLVSVALALFWVCV